MLLCTGTLSVFAQSADSPGAPLSQLPRPVASAVKIDEAVVIDGQLDEGMWQSAVPLGNFVQAEPFQGQLVSERTEVRILYDDEAIYVGVTCFDANPSLIVTTDTRRDPALANMDSFQMIFDTFHDKQNGFVFGTNVAGVQYDAQVRFQGEQDTNWDGSWDVATGMSDTAWTAEFRIPLRTLRYGPMPQTWGVNFFRNIQRTRERAYWAPIERVFNLARLSSAGDLRGLQLQTPRNARIHIDAVPLQPWARALTDYRHQLALASEPYTRCKPAGGPRQFMSPYGLEIVELRELQRVYIFNISNAQSFRTIFMDGRGHPAVLTPGFLGHSIGRWDGDTLVVQSSGFRDGGWLDVNGSPFTDKLKLTERFTRLNYGTLRIDITVDDPKAYTKPWTVRITQRLTPEDEMIEFICNENEQSSRHYAN